MLEETASGSVALSPFVISVCRGQGCPRQYILAVWILFVRPRTFLPPGMGYEPDIKWVGVPRSFGPTIIILIVYHYTTLELIERRM